MISPPTEFEPLKESQINQSLLKTNPKEGKKSKTSLRLEYEAKAHLIQKQLGGLKGIQSLLGLNQRKLAQLLMVDPSTWNRWLKNEHLIPPHIWRTLEWYLALQNKVPGLEPQYFIGRNVDDIKAQLNLESSQIQFNLKNHTEKEIKTIIEKKYLELKKEQKHLIIIFFMLQNLIMFILYWFLKN